MIKQGQPILVVGAAGIDLKGTPHHALDIGASSPGIIKHSYGGVARNIAENLARLGESVCLLSVIGDDAQGAQLRQATTQSGVDMSHVLVQPAARTGCFLSIMNQDGDLMNGIGDYDIMTKLDSAYLDSQKDCFAQAGIVVLDLNISEDALRTSLNLAEQFGLDVVIDPTSPRRAEKLRPYLSHAYLITPSATEAEVLSGMTVYDHESGLLAAAALGRSGVDVVLITLGEAGMVYAHPTGTGHIPAQRANVLDTTGAGDALTAGVIFGLINGISLDDAMRLGNAAATLTLATEQSVAPNMSPDLLYNALDS